MSGFELTPFGIVPLGTKELKTPEEAALYVIRRDEPAAQIAVVAHAAQQHSVGQQPIKRGSLIKQVRARIREIKAELKHLGALQTELQELERLLQAAKQKPTASVRPLRSVG